MSNKELTPEEIAENVVNKTDIIKAITHERKLSQEGQDMCKDLTQEVFRLRRIIAKEITENDELGAEFVYVYALKAKLKLAMDVVDASRAILLCYQTSNNFGRLGLEQNLDSALMALDKWVGGE